MSFDITWQAEGKDFPRFTQKLYTYNFIKTRIYTFYATLRLDKLYPFITKCTTKKSSMVCLYVHDDDHWCLQRKQ